MQMNAISKSVFTFEYVCLILKPQGTYLVQSPPFTGYQSDSKVCCNSPMSDISLPVCSPLFVAVLQGEAVFREVFNLDSDDGF